MAEETNWIDNDPGETRAARVQRLIEAVTTEIKKAHSQKYDMDDAMLTASLALEAQKELAEFLAEAEFLSKEAANRVDYLEGEKYFYYKTTSVDKTTDQGLKYKIASDKDIMEAKAKQSQAEADYNKWRNLFGILKDAHVLFRNIGRGKSDF